MLDGHLNKCKDCTKRDSKQRGEELRKDAVWLEQEKTRHRDKYHRLNYRERHKPTQEAKRAIMKAYTDKYPEKRVAKIRSQHVSAPKGFHNHHWSYRIEDAKDTIQLTHQEHYRAHRYLKYDQQENRYRTAEGVLLDTKEKHLEYIKSLGEKK